MDDDGQRNGIAAASARMTLHIGVKRAIKNLPGRLLPVEVVEHMTSCSYARGTGLVVLTNQRFLAIRDDFAKEKVEDARRADIVGVELSSGTLGGLTVSTPAQKITVRALQEFGDEIARALRSGRADATVPANAAPPAPGADVPLLLQKLADLRDAGVLTEDEFTAKKAELLGRL
jgi:hypothetical protein